MSTLVSFHPDTAAVGGGVARKHDVDCSDTDKPDYPNKKTRVEEKKKKEKEIYYFDTLPHCSDSESEDDDPHVSLVPKEGFSETCECYGCKPCRCGGKIIYFRNMCNICGVIEDHPSKKCPQYASFQEMLRKKYKFSDAPDDED